MKVLFATFPQQPGDLAAQLEAYSIALDGHDERDIAAAVRRFIRGEVTGHNPSFPPTASKLGAEVRVCMNGRLDAEHRNRPPELPAPLIEKTPEQRAKVEAVLEEVRANLAKMGAKGRVFGSIGEDAA